MKANDGIVRAQVDALKDLLEKSRNSHCSDVLGRAQLEAAEIRRRARRQARERVTRAAHEERERLNREVRKVEAEIETEQRRRARQRDGALIEAGRAALAGAIAERWQNRARRDEWAAAAMAEASEVLLGRDWTLEHPVDWPAQERERALALARERYGAEIDAAAADDLECGLRIRSHGALVDMSIPGLLANERTIEGELLAEIARAAAGEET